MVRKTQGKRLAVYILSYCGTPPTNPYASMVVAEILTSFLIPVWPVLFRSMDDTIVLLL